jgi:tetratricopeptide (TPR) repeat protein
MLEARLWEEQRRLDYLSSGDLSCREVFDQSYSHRERIERQAFRLLGLMGTSSFPAWAASALLNVEPRRAEMVIESLVESQLLQAGGKDAAGQTRYQLHDLLRIFAQDRLLAEESRQYQRQALERLIRTYTILARYASVALEASNEIGETTGYEEELVDASSLIEAVKRAPYNWFVSEYENLLASVRQAYDLQYWRLTLDLVDALNPFLQLHSPWDEWQGLEEYALAAAQRLAAPDEEARVAGTLGLILASRNEFTQAIDYYDRSLRILRELGDKSAEARILGNLGITHERQGRFVEAVNHYQQSLNIFEELADRVGKAQTFGNLGNAYQHLERLGEAEAAYKRCLVLFKDLDDRHGKAQTTLNLGNLYRRQGRFNDAIDCYSESRAILRDMGDRRGEGSVLSNLGLLLNSLGERPSAEVAWRQALSILQDLKDPEARDVEAWLTRKGPSTLIDQSEDND